MLDAVKTLERVTTKLSQKFKKIKEVITDSDSGIEVGGHMSIICRERGKLRRDLCREGHNIWLLTGRAYDAAIKSYQSYGPDVPLRNDRIKYIGIGSGTQPEVSTITHLVTPIAWDAGNHFLAQLNIPYFPTTDGTIVRYAKLFGLTDISITGTVVVQEVGLFTDGNPPLYVPGTRDTTLVNALAQSPLCYKTFEPLPKTQDVDMSFVYELRHV